MPTNVFTRPNRHSVTLSNARFGLRAAFALCVVLLGWAADADAQLLKPFNLDKVNTDKDEDDPHLASKGLQLFYGSNATGKWEVMVARRRTTTQPWPAGKPAPEFESKGKDEYRSVFLTPDGFYPQRLYYATNKDPEKTDLKGDNFDIYFLTKQIPSSDFTEPFPLQSVCTEADELYPWLTRDGLRFYFSRKDKEGWHLYVAGRKTTKEQFAKPERLNMPDNFYHATLTPDGKTMYLQGPLENDRWGLFRSTLAGSSWSKPEPLTELNDPDGPTGDRSPNLSRDGYLLYFASDRPGGKGGLDLYFIRADLLGRKSK